MFKMLILHPMKGFLFVALLMFVSACQNQNGNSLLELNDFKTKVGETNAQVIDVRSEDEYKRAHIPNAINVSTNDEYNNLQYSFYPDLPTYIYGLAENDATIAAQKLHALKFKNLYVLKGGFNDWKGAGLPVEAQKEKRIYENDTIPFEVARNGSKLVVADFNAVWCGPCKMLEPYIHRLRDNRSDEVIVYSIDTDKRKDLMEEYKAYSIPLVLFMKNNKILYRSEGYMEEAKLNRLVDQYK